MIRASYLEQVRIGDLSDVSLCLDQVTYNGLENSKVILLKRKLSLDCDMIWILEATVKTKCRTLLESNATK